MKLDDSKYINRIICAIKLGSSNTGNEFTISMVNYVINFLQNINKYASKGDHANFERRDAISCIIYTYLLLGDILAYYVKKNE